MILVLTINEERTVFVTHIRGQFHSTPLIGSESGCALHHGEGRLVEISTPSSLQALIQPIRDCEVYFHHAHLYLKLLDCTPLRDPGIQGEVINFLDRPVRIHHDHKYLRM